MFCHPYSITIFIRIERKDREIKWGKKDEEAEREREKGREREEERARERKGKEGEGCRRREAVMGDGPLREGAPHPERIAQFREQEGREELLRGTLLRRKGGPRADPAPRTSS